MARRCWRQRALGAGLRRLPGVDIGDPICASVTFRDVGDFSPYSLPEYATSIPDRERPRNLGCLTR